MGARLIVLVRLLLGAVYLANGLNWYHKIITPYPSVSDFVHFKPPPDIVGALIDNGWLFYLAKTTELVTGLSLLLNVFTPLSLVLAMTVTAPVFVVDGLNPHPHLRALLMGTGSLVMNLFLLLAYFPHYRAMFAVRGAPSLDPTAARPASGDRVAGVIAAVARPVLPALGVVAAALGLAMVCWLGVMIVQYVLHPLPLSAIHRLQPR